ncbi:MAG: WbqC family protein [Gammaproteobacteria bacterium]|nr:WbqC family protein [Gammaproteobacteria bacterium]
MKLAVMQPYFFPYIGYWQLLHAADTFVLLDDVQYIQGGWINRNRILKLGGGWRYISVPLKKHSANEPIKNIHAHGNDWKLPILRQLEHYGHKNRAPHYREVKELLQEIFSRIGNEESIVKINESIVHEVCQYLGVTTRVLTSSSQNLDYANVHDAGEWSLRIAEQMRAREYINPIGGKGLFDPGKYQASNVKLSFLKSDAINYAQGGEFEPSLSIVDVLMFNGAAGTRELLDKYSIESAW